MRIILSRKGFDSANGKVPSPIFPSGKMRSLPIPEPTPSTLGVPIHYGQIAHAGQPLAGIISDLTGAKVKPSDAAHLDPDLDAQSLPRPEDWRPVFVQNGAAEGHLRKAGVQAGDVFLFFGWFRRVDQVSGRYRYIYNAPDLHVIFGWLQIEQRIPLTSRSQIPPWALYHPHAQMIDPHSAGSLYLSTPHLGWPVLNPALSGGGVFTHYDPPLCLTDSGSTRSIWRLPGWFHPVGGIPGLSFHEDSGRWERDGDDAVLRSVGRGQEFVLYCDHYPEAIPWLAQLLS